MKWEISAGTNNNEVHTLYKDDKKLLTLTFNPFSSSARVDCNNEKRVFLIRKEGFRRNKTVLRTEYGFKIGELSSENKENFISVNDEKFYYTIQNNPMAELIIYKESKEQPFLVCSLSAEKGNTGIRFSEEKGLSTAPHPGLLMAICWYMFLPVAKENVAEYAG